MTGHEPTEYDELPYTSVPIPATAPEQLATVSLLFGGPTPPVRGGRLLEIGCGDGANLLPVAFHRPDMTLVGVDTSAVQIEAARRAALSLGLRNLELTCGDASELELEGPFDYVVMHGVLSWIAPAVRARLLRRSCALLSAEGLVYVSYNTHPGWKARGIVRDALHRYLPEAATLRARAGAARELAGFMAEQLGEPEHPYAALLLRELGRVTQADDAYLVHEYLTEHNQAFWLHELVGLAGEHGLRYVGEAGFNEITAIVPSRLREAVEARGLDPVASEELIDVLWYRQHRTSILCRAEVPDRGVDLSVIDRLGVAAVLRPARVPVPLDADEPVRFEGAHGMALDLSTAPMKAMLVTLAARWPRGLPFPELLDETDAALRGAGALPLTGHDRTQLRDLVLGLCADGQLELRLREPPTHVQGDGRCPEALALTRFEAARRAMVTTAGHQRLPLDPADRWLVARLDGERPLTALCAELSAALAAGALPEVLASLGEAAGTLAALAGKAERLVALLSAWGLLAPAD